MLESILRMEVAQMCQQDDDDAVSDGMIKKIGEEALEDVSYVEQPEMLGLANREIELPKPSIEELPELELKSLSNHLKYAYIGSFGSELASSLLSLSFDANVAVGYVVCTDGMPIS
ncbi:hypothetical protein V6N13_015202 [Hibiscus sabdariffa]